MAIVKYPGQEWGGTVRLTYKGPGNIVRIYIALRTDPYDYWNAPLHWYWGGGEVVLKTAITETVYEFPTVGIFPDDIPQGILIDVFKMIAWQPIDPYIGNKAAFGANLAAVDRDDEVYTMPPSVFDISRPESTWF